MKPSAPPPDNVIDLPRKASLTTVRAIAKLYPVFPCRPKDETDGVTTKKAKSPRTTGGFGDASRSLKQIESWWRQFPDSLVSVPTGAITRLVAVDYDGPEGAAWIEANRHRLPATQINRTRRGGHLLFAYPARGEVRCSTGRVAPGIDVRGAGGYIIWWPAHGYTVEDEGVFAEIPDWLLDLIRRPKLAAAPKAEGDGTFSASQLDRLLSQIPADDYSIWIQVGQILKDDYDDFDRWLDWSRQSAKFKGEGECRQKWGTFHGSGLTSGTLVHLAGGKVPPTSPEEDFEGAPDVEVDADGGTVEDGGDEDPIFSTEPGRKKSSSIPVLDVATFLKRSRPQWRVKHLLPETGLALIFGASQSGKTFLALDLVAAILAGQPWGKDGLRVRKGRAVYVAAEGPGGFRNRVEALTQQGKRLDGMKVIPAAPLITTDKAVKELIGAIKDSGIGVVDVIVLDTLSQVTSGLDENSAEMSVALRSAQAIREAFNCLVMFVGHSGKDPTKGHRGWTGVFAAVDTAIEVTRNEEIRTATVTKQRDGESGNTYSFILHPVDIGFDEDGDAITTCLLDHCMTPETRRETAHKRPRLGGVQGKVLDMIPENVDADRDEIIAKLAQTLPRGEGKKDKRKEHARRALDDLIAKRLVVQDGSIVRIPTGDPQALKSLKGLK